MKKNLVCFLLALCSLNIVSAQTGAISKPKIDSVISPVQDLSEYQYEYQTETFVVSTIQGTNQLYTNQFQSHLNDMGTNEWELMSVTLLNDFTSVSTPVDKNMAAKHDAHTLLLVYKRRKGIKGQ
jgi:hypothetical protein